MPVKNDVLEKRTTQQHYQPISIKRHPFAGCGNVVKVFDSVPESQPNGLGTKPENKEYFSPLKLPDIRKSPRKSGVYMVAINPILMVKGRSGRLFTHVTAKSLQHELNHVALAMVWRWRVGKDEQFHLRFAVSNLRCSFAFGDER